MIIDNIMHKEFFIVKGLSFMKTQVKIVKVIIPIEKDTNLADQRELKHLTAYPQ